MATFQSLSDEILLVILRFIPHTALPKMAAVSKGLSRCSTPEIYRYVHYHDTWNPPRFPDWRGRYPQVCGQYGDTTRRDTRIFDLARFLRSVSESVELRSHVVGASFHCNTSDGDGIAMKVAELLRLSIQHLHLAPFGAVNSMLPILRTVTSLEIRVDHLQPIPGSDSIQMDRCYDIFCLPSLRSLSIVGVRSWTTDENPAQADSSRSRHRTSNIACLSLLATVPPGPNLVEILSWPVSLQSLHYELCPDEENNFGFGMPTISPLYFSTALESQKMCLEELIVYGDCQGDDKGYMDTEVIDLRSFSRLKVVGLDIGYMMVSKLDAECADAKIDDFPAMCELMPLSLEHLQVQTNEYSFAQWFSVVPPSDMGVVAAEISDALVGLVRSKDGSCKALKSVSLWRPMDCTPVETALNDIEGCDKLLACARSAGVEVSGWVSSEPPLFGAATYT